MRSTKRAMHNDLESCWTVGRPVGTTLEVAWSETPDQGGSVPAGQLGLRRAGRVEQAGEEAGYSFCVSAIGVPEGDDRLKLLFVR